MRPRTGSKKQIDENKWVVRVSSGYKQDGTQRRITRTIFGTEHDADLAIMKLSQELGVSPNMGDELTLDEYVYSVFLPNRTNLTNATLKAYEGHYRCHIKETFGHMPLSQITRQQIQAWLSQRPAKSARNHMRTMSAIMNGAVEDGFLDVPVVMTHMRYPRRPFVDPTEDSWTIEQVVDAFYRLENERIYPLWLCMAGAGLSRSEGCALEWNDVIEENGVCLLSVTKANTPRDGLKEPKNKFRRRVVPLPEPFGQALLQRRSEGRIWPLSASHSAVEWTKLFKEGKALDGMPFVHLGRMRATHETMLQLAGVVDSVNARLHGRSNIQTGYIHYQATRIPAFVDAQLAMSEKLLTYTTDGGV